MIGYVQNDLINSPFKLCQNKKGQRFFELHCFGILFSSRQQIKIQKKDSKTSVAEQMFGPFYFFRVLVWHCIVLQVRKFAKLLQTYPPIYGHSRKPGNDDSTIILKVDIMKKSSPINSKFPFLPLSKPK